MEVKFITESPQTQSPGEFVDSIILDVDRDALALYLGHPDRAHSTLNLSQTEGFLFAVACCPQDVSEFDWLQIVLGDSDDSDSDDAEVDISRWLVMLYQEIAQDVEESRYQLPAECQFSWDAEERLVFEQWCEGVLLADQWLEPRWVEALSQAYHRDMVSYEKLSRNLDDTIGLLKIMVDVDVALEILEKEAASEVDDFRQQLKDSFQVINDYLGSYVRAGTGLAVYYHSDPQVRQEPKVGRNDTCPCGSGKKYKKCCLS